MFIILSYIYIYIQPTGAPTIDPVKAALEKRATEAELKLDTVNAKLKTCTVEKQEAETKQKEVAEVAKKSSEDVNTLKKQLAGSLTATTREKKEAAAAAEKVAGLEESLKKAKEEAEVFSEAAKKEVAVLQSQLKDADEKLIESEKTAKEAAAIVADQKKAAGKLQAALAQSQEEAARTKKALGEVQAKAEETATALQAKLEQSQAAADIAIEKSQAEAADKLQGLQAAVCKEIAQVESAQTQSALVEKEVAEKAKQALGRMEVAMKEMTASCVPEAPVDVVYKQESEKLNEVKDFQVQGLTSLTSKEFNDAVKYIPQNVNFKLQEFNDASPQDKLFYEAKNVEDIEPVVLKPASKEAASVAFDLSKLDQQQDVKQNELEEELNRASGKVEFSYLAKNAAEEQYVQISRQDVISRAQDGLGAQCSAATQKFIELAVAMITGDHKDTAINVIGRDQTADLVTYRGQLTDLIGRDQELIDITGKDQVIELEPVNDIDLSSLVSIVGCGAVKKQQLVKVDSGNFPFEVVKYPLVSEKDAKYDGTSLQYVKAEVDNTDTDGN